MTQRGCCSVGSVLTWPVIMPAPVRASKDWAECSRLPAEAAISPPSYIHVRAS
jgi:hypothetical protein